jgi:hypothetical protein
MLLARLAAPATLTLALLAAPLVATTQSTRNVARIGWLTRSRSYSERRSIPAGGRAGLLRLPGTGPSGTRIEAAAAS